MWQLSVAMTNNSQPVNTNPFEWPTSEALAQSLGKQWRLVPAPSNRYYASGLMVFCVSDRLSPENGAKVGEQMKTVLKAGMTSK